MGRARARWSQWVVPRAVLRAVAGGEQTGSVRPGQDLVRAQELPEGERVVLVLVLAVVRCGATHAAIRAFRGLWWRTHGQVISAHAAAPRTSAESRYHGHGPSTSSSDLTTGLVVRKP